MLRGAKIHSFPLTDSTTCLFLRLLEIDQLGEHHDKAAKLLDGFVAHKKREQDIIPKGRRSKVDIAIEMLVQSLKAFFYVVFCWYSDRQGKNRKRKRKEEEKPLFKSVC